MKESLLARIFRCVAGIATAGHYFFAHRNRPSGKIKCAGRVYDHRDMINLVNSSLDFTLTADKYASQLEKRLANYIGVRYSLLTNSGSSANLLAVSALTSTKLKERRLNPGDEIITVAAGFPSTISPIIQCGCVPVFVDITIPEYNIDVSMLEYARSSRTKAVIVAHTLGNPFNVKAVRKFCDLHGLWMIEDNCDAMGAEYLCEDGIFRKTGSAGDISTVSFYPAHQITMGEGGAVFTDDPLLRSIIASFRDWGRDCWCNPGKDNSCGKRFGYCLGQLPIGYDHKYTYSHFGYNLKVTDMQAAIGCSQLDKLDSFIAIRNKNWSFLRSALSSISDQIILPYPTINSLPSWFGFMVTLRDSSKRNEVIERLERRGIQTRMLFAGNFLRQPCFDEIRESNKYRVAGELRNTDFVMKSGFWVGVYPGISEPQIKIIAETIIGCF